MDEFAKKLLTKGIASTLPIELSFVCEVMPKIRCVAFNIIVELKWIMPAYEM